MSLQKVDIFLPYLCIKVTYKVHRIEKIIPHIIIIIIIILNVVKRQYIQNGQFGVFLFLKWFTKLK